LRAMTDEDGAIEITACSLHGASTLTFMARTSIGAGDDEVIRLANDLLAEVLASARRTSGIPPMTGGR